MVFRWLEKRKVIPMNIAINPDEEEALRIKKLINNNGGYKLGCNERNKSTKCICQDFLESDKLGLCDCGLYIKREV